MGLDTTHGCWSGPYSSFHRFRIEVAKAAGVPYMLMEGCFGPSVMPSDGEIDHTHLLATKPRVANLVDVALEWCPIKWSALRPDPIHTLLNHSDYEGEIAVEDLIPLADRLEELAPDLPDEPKWHRGESARAKAIQFAAGLREAARLGEPVEFR